MDSEIVKIKKVLGDIEKSCNTLCRKVLEIEEQKEDILEQISIEYNVSNPEKVYVSALEDFIENSDECLCAKKFFKLQEGILAPDEEMTFLYCIWNGDYYTECSEISALEKYASEIRKKADMDFLDFCKRFSE